MKQIQITVIALTALLVTNAGAGELECGFGGCDLDGIFPSIEWKPSGCSKPSKPFFYVSDTTSFNFAVDEYNSYVNGMQTYLNCIVSEAESDIRKIPIIINEGVSKARSEALSEVQGAKSDLEISRPIR